MPLDPVGQRYAQNLFVTKSEQLTKERSDQVIKVRQDFAKRGINPGNAGFYHTQILEINLQHVEAIANARADSLIEAYDRAGSPLDNEAVADITQKAHEWINGQITHAANNAKAV